MKIELLETATYHDIEVTAVRAEGAVPPNRERCRGCVFIIQNCEDIPCLDSERADSTPVFYMRPDDALKALLRRKLS